MYDIFGKTELDNSYDADDIQDALDKFFEDSDYGSLSELVFYPRYVTCENGEDFGDEDDDKADIIFAK